MQLILCSHAFRIKQQYIIKAIKKEIHHTAPEDTEFRDILELKDTISEKRRYITKKRF